MAQFCHYSLPQTASVCFSSGFVVMCMVQFCHYSVPQTASVCFYRGCVVSVHGPVLSLYKIQEYKIQETLFNVGYSKTVNISYKLFSDKHHYSVPQTASVCFYRGCVVSVHCPVPSLLSPSDSFSMLLQGLCGKYAWSSSVTTQSLKQLQYASTGVVW